MRHISVLATPICDDFPIRCTSHERSDIIMTNILTANNDFAVEQCSCLPIEMRQLILEVADNLNLLIWHQALIELAIEQAETLTETTGDKVTLLLDNYSSRSKLFLDEMNINVTRLIKICGTHEPL